MKRIIVVAFILLTMVSTKAESGFKIVSDTTLVTNDFIVYETYSDLSNVYVNISTSDKNTMISMLKLGLTVYFDIKGKKKKNVFVRYPVKKTGSSFKKRNVTDKNSSILFKNMINDLPNEAQYSYYGENQPFHILLNNLDILVSMEYDHKIQTLLYKIIIPKYRIESNTKKDLSKMTIGVVSGEFKDRNTNDQGRKGSSGLSMKGGGGRGSGGGRGGGGGRSKGGSVKSEPTQQTDRAPMITINYWIDAQLKD